ncbi:YdcF family protein [Mucilaginibacter sp.]|uniref:YdcF family protein n=1 Tax=Mucilaginibacter sp. TaxID=1882438 RepID=UPI003264BB65
MFWIFLMLVWAVFAKNAKRKKRLLFISIGTLYFFSNTFVIKQLTNWWDIPSQNTGNKTYSCAIVLGGFTSVDNNGKGYFNSASTRFIETLKLQATGKVSKIMITGGSGLLLKGHDFKEADFTAEQMRILKIPDSVMLTENQSRNTMENALFSKKVLADHKIPGPYLLVTSAYHMRRSVYTFKKAGLDVIPYTSDYVADKGAFSIADIMPNAVALAEWNTYTKEMIGYIAYHFKKF